MARLLAIASYVESVETIDWTFLGVELESLAKSLYRLGRPTVDDSRQQEDPHISLGDVQEKGGNSD